MLNSNYQTIDQILQLFNNMMSILEIDQQIEPDQLNTLFNQKLYIQIANKLFPFLQYNLLQIQKKKQESSQKLQKLIRLLQQDIVKRDLSHIKGRDIAKGNLKSIYDFVIILFQLTKRHLNNLNLQDDQNQDQQQEQQNSEAVHSVLGIQNQFDNDENSGSQIDFNQKMNTQQQNKEMKQMKHHEQDKKKYENIIMNNKLIEHQVKQMRSQSKQQLKYDNKKSQQISDNYGDFLERKNKEQNKKNVMKHYKSNKSIKQTIKKNIQNQLFNQKTTNKKLTTDSKMRKIISPQRISKAQKQLNKMALTQIKNTRQKIRSLQPDIKLIDKQSQNEILKKKKQLKLAMKQYNEKKSMKQNAKKQFNDIKIKNEQKKIKMLRLKKAQLKKQAKLQEAALDMKLRDQKFRYVKKINGIVQKLQKDKNIGERKQFRQRLLLQNKLTSNKLQALQNHYRSQINLLKQKQTEDKKQRKVIQNAHKQIINRLQKQLKKDNQLKVAKIQQRYRQQYNKLLDLTTVEDELVKLYKKY